MGAKKDTPEGSELRQRAEKLLEIELDSTEALSEMPPEKIASLIHELQVHQIELNMQNEELCRIQDDLEKTRDRYSHLYDFAPIGYFSMNQEGVIDEANLTFASMVGVARGDLVGGPFTRFVLRDDQDGFYKHRQHLLETEAPQSCELRLVKKDGQEFYARLECTVITNGGEGGKQIRVAVIDVTDFKQVEEALQESEKRFHTVADFTYDWEYWIAPDGHYVYISPSCERITGYGPAAFYADSALLEKLIHPEDPANVSAHIAEVQSTKQLPPVDFRIINRMGETRWIGHVCQPVYDNDGVFLGRRSSNRDITDRKQAEESLQRMKNRLESIWNITKVADAEIKTICDRVLTEAQKMTGSKYAFYGFISEDEKTMALHAWSQETHSDCNVEDKTIHFPIEKAGIWADAVRKRQVVTLNDFPSKALGKRGLPHGHVTLTRLMVVPLVVGDKVLSIAAVANKQDKYTEADEKQMQAFLKNVQILIDRKNAEEKKLELMHQLQRARKMETIVTLAGGIAHDYNNLLAIIMGNLSMAQEKAEPHSAIAKFLQRIEEASCKTRDLTHQFLALSKGGYPRKERGSIGSLLKAIPKQVQANERIEYIFSIQNDLWSVEHDSKQIQDAITNVLKNAVEAMPQGGAITVQAENLVIDNKVKDPALPLNEGRYVKISIKDEGPGIPEEHMDKVFDPYFSTKSRGVQKGMGLGLTTTYAVVEKHGGHITLSSTTGVGTTVNIYLPASERPEKQSARHPG